MSGRGSSSRCELFFRRLTPVLVSGFVLLQAVVFIVRVVRYEPRRADEVCVVHDTVYVRDSAPRNHVPASGNHSAARGRRYRRPERGEPEQPLGGGEPHTGAAVPENGTIAAGLTEKKELPAAGDSGWKWDVVELNSADSAALDGLPGIGGYYAKSILRYRQRLGAFTEAAQLLEIRGMDSARFARIAPRVRIDSSLIRWMDLRTVPEDTLSSHPYVGRMAARGIIRLREVLPPGEFSLEAIVSNGILSADAAARLGRYLMK